VKRIAFASQGTTFILELSTSRSKVRRARSITQSLATLAQYTLLWISKRHFAHPVAHRGQGDSKGPRDLLHRATFLSKISRSYPLVQLRFHI